MGPTLSVIILAVVRSIGTVDGTSRASRSLHNKMAWSVLRAKIEFFDTNPLGRILNRFSADVGITDDLLPFTLFDFLVGFFFILGGIATTISVLPFTTIAFFPLLAYFFYLRRVFLSSSREIKRLDGISRSPIHDMLSESLNGIATIRTNSAVEYFQSKFEGAHDTNIRAYFSFISIARWLGFRLDFILFLFVALSSYSAVLFHNQGW